MSILRFFLINLVFILVSCDRLSDNEKTQIETMKRFEENSYVNRNNINSLNYLMDDYLEEQQRKHLAIIYKPAVDRIFQNYQYLDSKIERLKEKIIHESNLKEKIKTENDKDSIKYNIHSFHTDFLEIDRLKKELDSLYLLNSEYISTSMNDRGSHIKERTREEMKLFKELQQKNKIQTWKCNSNLDWYNYLLMIQNKNEVESIRLTQYCIDNIPSMGCFRNYNTSYCVFSLDHYLAKKNQNINLSMFLVNTEQFSLPKYYINNKEIKTEEYQYLNYKFKAPNKSGNYSIQAKVIYLTPSGDYKTEHKTLRYQVVDSVIINP